MHSTAPSYLQPVPAPTPIRLMPDNPSALSPTLVHAVQDFKTIMIDTDCLLKDNKLSGSRAQLIVNAACDGVESVLREHGDCNTDLERSMGRYVQRELFPYFMFGDLNDRAYSKPRGYAGDYATIEMLYTDVASGRSRLGPLIDRWTRELPAARAVRNRRTLMVESISTVAARWTASAPLPVTSLASGPARELFDVVASPKGPRMIATAIDVDPAALQYAADRARRLGVADQFRFARENVLRLTHGRGRTILNPQALIYSVGLTDYLQDAYVVDLINWAYDNLLPGGTLIIGNVMPTNPTRVYMDQVLEWVLVHRTAEQLQELFARSRFASTPVSLRCEPAGVDLFAFCTRN